MVRLVCPFCRAVVVDGSEPEPGECPNCGAAFAGGADSAPAGVRAALAAWGMSEDPDEVAATLFAADPDDPAAAMAITSDERDAFYRWWVFRRAG